MSKIFYRSLAFVVMASLPFQGANATSILQTPPSSEAAAAPARAFFIDLKNNDEVTSPFTVKFGIEGMKIAPAGISKSGTGHFHLFIDAEPLTEAQQKNPIPADMKHIHFGGGQTQTNLTLPPGEHKLQLVMGDGAHKLHNPPVMSEVITIKVK